MRTVGAVVPELAQWARHCSSRHCLAAGYHCRACPSAVSMEPARFVKAALRICSCSRSVRSRFGGTAVDSAGGDPARRGWRIAAGGFAIVLQAFAVRLVNAAILRGGGSGRLAKSGSADFARLDPETRVRVHSLIPHELDRSIALYDARAPRYDTELTARPNDRLAREAFVDLVMRHVPVGGTVLDFGCGTGLDAAESAAAVAC